MNYKMFVLCVFMIFILSSCSGDFNFGNTDNVGPEDKNHGAGLDVDFTIDDDFLPRISYELRLENEGEETIELSPNDFKITSNKRDLSGDVPIEREGVENFRKNLFENGGLMLGPNQERTYTGQMRIKEDYYSDLTNDEIDIDLELSYPYEVDFSTNAIINPDNLNFRAESFDLSGPIEISNIEGNFLSEDELEVVFTLKDRKSSNSIIRIENEEFVLGSNRLNCEVYKDEGGSKIQINSPRILPDNNKLFYVCVVGLTEYESETTTIVSGEYEYVYRMSEENVIEFPEKRSNSFN